jgi:hypothetical protein
MMGLTLPTPDHTTLSRRSHSLKPILFHRACPVEPVHLIVDSTGLSIHGAGPWSSGKKRRRGWRKLHIMVDEDGSIRSSCVSKWYTRDGRRVPHLLDGFDGDIASLTGDRGYDQRSVYRSVALDAQSLPTRCAGTVGTRPVAPDVGRGPRNTRPSPDAAFRVAPPLSSVHE